jgi:arginine/ornithine N-succinyltransferase beta subunit
MGLVVGCGVVNVMVGLSVYKFAYCIRLVVHACPTVYHQFPR